VLAAAGAPTLRIGAALVPTEAQLAIAVAPIAEEPPIEAAWRIAARRYEGAQLWVVPLIMAEAVTTVAAIVIRIINIAAEVPTTAVAASIAEASIAAARWREAEHIVVRRYAAVGLAGRMLPTAAVAADAGKNNCAITLREVPLSILLLTCPAGPPAARIQDSNGRLRTPFGYPGRVSRSQVCNGSSAD